MYFICMPVVIHATISVRIRLLICRSHNLQNALWAIFCPAACCCPNGGFRICMACDSGTFFSPNTWALVHQCYPFIMLRISILASLVQICSPRFRKLFMQNMCHSLWQNKEPNNEIHILTPQIKSSFAVIKCIRQRMYGDIIWDALWKWDIEYPTAP